MFAPPRYHSNILVLFMYLFEDVSFRSGVPNPPSPSMIEYWAAACWKPKWWGACEAAFAQAVYAQAKLSPFLLPLPLLVHRA